LSVPECHRSALLNMITDPAGAMIFTSSGCGPIPDPNASMSIGGWLTRREPGMTRSGPLSGVKAVIHHMADSVCHRPAVRLFEVGMQPLVAAAGQGCAEAQRGQIPIRPEHRCRGLSQQRMVAARRECRIGQFQLRVHHPRLGDA